jgi:hypothetical protein
MDLDQLWKIAERARDREKLSPEELLFIGKTLPLKLAPFPHFDPPKSIKHPGGFSVSGAPVGTFLRSALLIAAQRALGKRYGDSEFYGSVEQDLAFRIMRSHFHLGYPKGTHCCVQCTLAIYPVLEAKAIRYFDCAELSLSLRQIIERREWRFAKPPNIRMLSWALQNIHS